jgi:hypothetical protein
VCRRSVLTKPYTSLRQCPTTRIDFGLSSADPALSEASLRCSTASSFEKTVRDPNAASSSKVQKGGPRSSPVGTLHDAVHTRISDRSLTPTSELHKSCCASSEPHLEEPMQHGPGSQSSPTRREYLSRDGNYLDIQMRWHQSCVGLQAPFASLRN